MEYSKIFLVDDCTTTNLYHQVMLRRFGVEERVHTVTDPELALDELRFNLKKDERVLVLLDLKMPEMDGFEFLEFMQLEELSTRIDVVMVTSSTSDTDRALAKRFPDHVLGYVNKPIRAAVVSGILEEAITAPLAF